MRRVQRTAQMAATPAEVYAFLAEPANLPRWQAGIVAAERTSPPPTAVGSTARVVLELMGQQVTAEITVREAEPERRLALASSVSGMGIVATLDLVAHDGGTEITLASEVRAENIFMAPLERMVTDAAERDLDASLTRLEAALALQ
ncbi:MAG TPA: SRPBCC family protein [Candidatus Limnocylindria bacterium]